MADLWKDFWTCETGTGQQVAQLHDRYNMMMMMVLVSLESTKEQCVMILQHYFNLCRSQCLHWLGVGLRPPVCWDREFESHRRHGRPSVVSVLCVLPGSGICDELITRPEESYRPWCVVVFWSRNLVNEKALAHWGGGAVAPQTIKTNFNLYCGWLFLHLPLRVCLSTTVFHSLVNNSVCDQEWPLHQMYLLYPDNYKYSKTCLKWNAIVPVFLSHFHRFPFYKGLCFNKTKYKKYDRLGLQWRNNLK